MSTNLFKFFTFSLLLSGSCFAKGGAVRIELLINDNEFTKLRENIKRIPVSLKGKTVQVQDVLVNEDRGLAPHISFLDVKDESGVIKDNYAQFIETVCNSLNTCNFHYTDKVGVYSKKESYITEAKNFWCLKEQNWKNHSLSKMAMDTKQKIEDFIQGKFQDESSKQDDFNILSPEQARMSLRNTTKENRDWVSLNNTFPHVTISKKENDFTSNDFVDAGKQLQLEPSFLSVTGVKITYNFEDSATPDLCIQKDFDAPDYLSGINRHYNLQRLLFEIDKKGNYKGVVSKLSEGDLYTMELLEYTLDINPKEPGESSRSSESDNDDIGRNTKEYYKNNSLTISNEKVQEMELFENNSNKDIRESMHSSESDNDQKGLSSRYSVNNNNNSRERGRDRRDDSYPSANNNNNRNRDRDFFANLDKEIERDREREIEKERTRERERRQERFKNDNLRNNNNNNNNNNRPQKVDADSLKNKRKYEGNKFPNNTKNIKDDFAFIL